MTGNDIFLALSEIDDELLIYPSCAALTVRKGRKRKKMAIVLVAAIMIFTLCAFGYASRLDMTYEDGVLEISVYNPNAAKEYEQWSMGYLAEGYEITQVSNVMWEVTNGSAGFYLSQISLSEDSSVSDQTEDESSFAEIQLKENIFELTAEDLKTMREVHWITYNCRYSVLVFGQTGGEAELVAMIQSITP